MWGWHSQNLCPDQVLFHWSIIQTCGVHQGYHSKKHSLWPSSSVAELNSYKHRGKCCLIFFRLPDVLELLETLLSHCTTIFFSIQHHALTPNLLLARCIWRSLLHPSQVPNAPYIWEAAHSVTLADSTGGLSSSSEEPLCPSHLSISAAEHPPF